MQSTGNKLNKEIIIFSAAALALSSLICFVAYSLENTNFAILSVFTPSIVALIMTARAKGRKGLYELFIGQTLQKIRPGWLLLSALGIPTLATLAVLIFLRFEISSFALRTTQLMPQLVVIALIANGEEYGWRGFLLPRLLERYSLLKSSLASGLIWGIWHYPAFLIGTGVPQEMDFAVFLLWVLLGTLFISWIYQRTRSVLTSILAHMGANAAFNYLPLLPEFTGSMETFWIFLALVAALLALIFFFAKGFKV